MKQVNAQKLGGIALIAGAIFLAAYAVLFAFVLPAVDTDAQFTAAVLHPYWIPVTLLAFAGVVLMMCGLTAVYARLGAGAGVIGLLGFLLTELAYLLQVCSISWEVFLFPSIASNEAFAPLLREGILWKDPIVKVFEGAATGSIALGMLLFCFSLIRSSEFPKVSGILILVGAFSYALGPQVSVFVAIAGVCVLSAGFLLLGLRLSRN